MSIVKKSPFEFKNIKVTRFYFEIKEDYEDIEYSINIERSVKILEIKTDLDKKVFERKVSLELIISDLEESPMVIQALISGEFRIENVTQEEATKLFEENAPSLLLSYLRPIISVATSKSSISYEIPFLDFRREKEDNN